MGCDAHDRVSFFQQSASSQADGRIQKLMIQEPTPTLLRPGHHWSWLRFQANHHFSSDALEVREDTSDSCLGSIHQPNPNCRPGWTNRRAHYFLGEAGRQGGRQGRWEWGRLSHHLEDFLLLISTLMLGPSTPPRPFLL